MRAFKFAPFSRFILFLIFLVYFLIFVGSLVRATGSGMGCPDWPKCFGLWIPPLSIEQVPLSYSNYDYSNLSNYGLEFNVFKTWTEYLNRLLGVFVGFFTLLLVFYSFRYFKKKSTLFYISVICLLVVILQGAIGAKVVSTNLAQSMINVHLLLALFLIGLLIFLFHISYKHNLVHIKSILFIENSYFYYTILISLIVTVVQICFGASVRNDVDTFKLANPNALINVTLLDKSLSLHSLFSMAVIVLSSITFMMLKLKFSNYKLIYYLGIALMILIFSELIIAYILVNFGLPWWSQPLHLTIAFLIFGVQFYIFLIYKFGFYKKFNFAI